MSLRKAEQELEKNEKKYHDATKEVEITRQACDAEMCRVSVDEIDSLCTHVCFSQGCDQMQTMELDRITEMDRFIQTYTSAMKMLTDTMNQVVIQT